MIDFQHPFTLASLSATPDLGFASIDQLARAVCALRDARPGRPWLSAISATVTRSDMPGGAAVALRLADSEEGGRGSLLGYAFMPRAAGAPAGRAAAALLAAIIAASPNHRPDDVAKAAAA